MTNLEIVENWRNSLLSDKKSENTVKTYIRNVETMLKSLDDMLIYDIKLEDLDTKYKRYLFEKKYAQSSYNQNVIAMRMFFKYLRDLDILDIDKDKLESRIKVETVDASELIVKGMSTKNFESLLGYSVSLPNSPRTQRNKVIFLLAITCGLRRIEIQNLKRTDVDIEKKIINLLVTKGAKISGKGKKSTKKRTIGLQGFVIKEILKLWEIYDEINLDGEYVILTSNNNMVAISQINRSINAIMRCAIEDNVISKYYPPHALRRSYALWLERVTNLSIKNIAKLLGHKNTSTTERYLVEDNESKLVEVVNKNNMLGGDSLHNAES